MNKTFRIKLARVSTLFFIFLLSGCVTDVANRYYSDESYPAKNFIEVELLSEKPNRKFTVIADFQSRGDTPKKLRVKAAKIGADAIIVSYVGGSYSLNEQWAKDDRYKNRNHSHILGTAIKYIQE